MPDDASILAQHEELQQLVERAEAAGFVEHSDLQETVDLIDIDVLDVEATKWSCPSGSSAATWRRSSG
jgi:hypothetical protein